MIPSLTVTGYIGGAAVTGFYSSCPTEPCRLFIVNEQREPGVLDFTSLILCLALKDRGQSKGEIPPTAMMAKLTTPHSTPSSMVYRYYSNGAVWVYTRKRRSFLKKA